MAVGLEHSASPTSGTIVGAAANPDAFRVEARPGGRFGLLMAFVVGLLALGGCASVPSDGYVEPDLPDDRVAILDWSGWDAAYVLEIDGKKPDPGGLLVRGYPPQTQARLFPGKHAIRYGGVVGTSVMLNPRMEDRYDRAATIDMKAGHVYAVRRKRVYGYPRSYQDYLWIEDTTTDEVMAGELPPHEREKAGHSQSAAAAREVLEHFEALSASAQCGDARAQYDLGLYYLAGNAPLERRDLLLAYVWYSLAASNGHADAAAVKERIRQEIPLEQLAGAEGIIADTQLAPCAMGASTPPDRTPLGQRSKHAVRKGFPSVGPP